MTYDPNHGNATIVLEGPVTARAIEQMADARAAVLASKDQAREAFLTASALFRSARQGLSRIIAQQIAALSSFLTFADKGKVGNAEIVGLLREGLDSAVKGIKAHVKQLDESWDPEAETETSAYRQYATKYRALARWQNKMWTKAEEEWLTTTEAHTRGLLGDEQWRWDGAVTVGEHTYLNPVAALDAGCTFSDVFKAWKDIVSPVHYDVGDYETSKKALKAASEPDYIKDLSVVLQVTPKEGGPSRRKALKILSMGSAIEGLVLGLLKTAPKGSFTEGRLERLAEAVEAERERLFGPSETPNI